MNDLMKGVTVRTFTDYQIEQLAGLFSLCKVLHLGRIDESGAIVIEYVPRYSDNQEIKAKKIPLYPETDSTKQ